MTTPQNHRLPNPEPTTPAASGWDGAYRSAPPWDIGRPQRPFVTLAEKGLLRGRLLDVGCGTGETTLLATEHGADALGVDASSRAIEIATAKASKRRIAAAFQTADALDLGRLGERFDTIVDSLVFHVFDDADRERYVESLVAATHPGSLYYMLCFSERTPGDWGPRRVRADEIRLAFSCGWAVQAIEPVDLTTETPAAPQPESDGGAMQVHGWLSTIRRGGG